MSDVRRIHIVDQTFSTEQSKGDWWEDDIGSYALVPWEEWERLEELHNMEIAAIKNIMECFRRERTGAGPPTTP